MDTHVPRGFSRLRTIAPYSYAESDGGPWYAIANRIRVAADFPSSSDAEAFLLWLAGEPLPDGWNYLPSGSNFSGIEIPGTMGPWFATIWLRDIVRISPIRDAQLKACIGKQLSNCITAAIPTEDLLRILAGRTAPEWQTSTIRANTAAIVDHRIERLGSAIKSIGGRLTDAGNLSETEETELGLAFGTLRNYAKHSAPVSSALASNDPLIAQRRAHADEAHDAHEFPYNPVNHWGWRHSPDGDIWTQDIDFDEGDNVPILGSFTVLFEPGTAKVVSTCHAINADVQA